jgi:UDP-N-acetyl-2-amino-2-deoxyglucuronate dehydrogenase
MFKSAVVGLGNIGPHHCKCYQSTREIQLGAVVDVNAERAERYGKDFGVPWFTHAGDVLKREDIDFIDLCIPSGHHGDLAIAAAKAGKHVISEKPMDVTPQRCDDIIKAFRKSKTVFGGIFQHRFADDSRRTKAAVDAGRLGRLTFVGCSTPWWRAQEYYDSGDWRGTWKLDGGGCLMNQGVHAIDLLLWICGPVKSIFARTALLAHQKIEVEDVAVATVEFENGALGVISGSTASFPGSAVRHVVTGTAGMINLSDDQATIWQLKDELGAQPQGGGAAATAAATVGAADDPAAVSTDIFVRNIDDIARAAREGRQPLVSAEEHRKAVECISAIYKSAQTGRPVKLPLRRFVPKA